MPVQRAALPPETGLLSSRNNTQINFCGDTSVVDPYGWAARSL
jgi:hypothetical protein